MFGPMPASLVVLQHWPCNTFLPLHSKRVFWHFLRETKRLLMCCHLLNEHEANAIVTTESLVDAPYPPRELWNRRSPFPGPLNQALVLFAVVCAYVNGFLACLFKFSFVAISQVIGREGTSQEIGWQHCVLNDL